MNLKQDIKHLFQEVIDFVKEDFNPWAYGWAALFVAALVSQAEVRAFCFSIGKDLRL